MKMVKKDTEPDRMTDKWDYEQDKKRGRLKYSDEQIEAKQWEEYDLNLVMKVLQKEKINNYFNNIVHKYETIPASDSMVRLDQEVEIAKDLRSHTPVLIRGNWRMGQTSMMHSLETHQFGEKNSIFIGVMTDKTQSFDDFQKNFGIDEIADFIAEKESFEPKREDMSLRTEQIRKAMINSEKNPFEFLNNYLLQKNEKVFLALDEVLGLMNQPEKIKYLASLKNLSQVQLAIIAQRIASSENTLKEIFNGYKTHFLRPLTIEEVGIMVRKPLEGTEVTFTDDAIHKILEFTGGRPMEIKNVCRALMHKSSQHKKYKFTYRAEDINILASKKFRNSKNRSV